MGTCSIEHEREHERVPTQSWSHSLSDGCWAHVFSTLPKRLPPTFVVLLCTYLCTYVRTLLPCMLVCFCPACMSIYVTYYIHIYIHIQTYIIRYIPKVRMDAWTHRPHRQETHTHTLPIPRYVRLHTRRLVLIGTCACTHVYTYLMSWTYYLYI
jgi:hypothetical protein